MTSKTLDNFVMVHLYMKKKNISKNEVKCIFFHKYWCRISVIEINVDITENNIPIENNIWEWGYNDRKSLYNSIGFIEQVVMGKQNCFVINRLRVKTLVIENNIEKSLNVLDKRVNRKKKNNMWRERIKWLSKSRMTICNRWMVLET